MANFAKDKPLYRKPEPLHKGWHYIGDGKFHDPSLGSDPMRGRRWMIDPALEVVKVLKSSNKE